MRALLSVVNTSVLHVDLAVRSAAGSCLTHFLKVYACDELLECSATYCRLLEDGVTERRIGGAVALGALPRALAAPCMMSIVPKLCSAIHMNTAKERGDVDARVAAIQVREFSPLHLCQHILRAAAICLDTHAAHAYRNNTTCRPLCPS